MWTRRELLKTAGGGAVAALAAGFPRSRAQETSGVEVNDVQSRLNLTKVNRILNPRTMDDLQLALRAAKKENRVVSVAGGRHAMGGQQFGADAIHLDMKGFSRVLAFDRTAGQIDVESGIEWPALLEYLHKQQDGQAEQWTIRQKQTGVDAVSLGGSLAANVHSRGLRFKPFIDDVESFDLLDADGQFRSCNRRENRELFGLAIGGYGLFGIITRIRLRLARRQKLQRIVKVISVREIVAGVEEQVRAGCLYGDGQYSTEIDAENPAHPCVFSCYRPVEGQTPLSKEHRSLSEEDWQRLYVLARTDKKKAFDVYTKHYLSTDGQIYWSDTHQLADKLDIRNLQESLVRRAGAAQRGSEMISEVYVRPDDLAPFLRAARKEILDRKIDLTYGTIRFIEKDDESFLAWATDRSVCILCNLHVLHTDAGRAKAAEDLRRLIGRAIERGGRYYLTYHRWATRSQVEAAYPQFVDFLRLKKKYDPQERFQSEWYRHYKTMFADRL